MTPKLVPEMFTEIGWRLGFFVPLIVIAAMIALALLFWLVPLAVERIAERRSKYSYPWDRLGFNVIAGVIAVCAAIVMAFQAVALIPYNTDYWKLYRATGEVANVSNVFTDASGELSESPVIELDGVDRPIEVHDPRAIYLDGHDVTLTCTIGWRYQAADRYRCELYEIHDADE